jgi:hypothetical protein
MHFLCFDWVKYFVIKLKSERKVKAGKRKLKEKFLYLFFKAASDF